MQYTLACGNVFVMLLIGIIKCLFLLYFFKKSDNSLKNTILKTTKIGLSGKLGLHSKKAPQSVLFDK